MASSVREPWSLDPEIRHLNHGAFGAVPRPLAAAQADWRARIERNPARFHMNELGPLLREAAASLAAFFGTAPERLAFVENVTSGIGAVLASTPLGPGDEVLTTDHVYGAVRHAARHHAERAGARLVEAKLGLPCDPARAVAALEGRMGPRTKLVLVDHVASPSGVILPVAAIVAASRRRGVPVLVDGAHAPGLLDLDVDALGADWYVGACHKWLCAPRGAAFIVAGRDPPWPVHPLVVSHAYGQGFTAEFDKTGTRDPSAWLTVPDAIRLHDELGGGTLRRRNAALAAEAAAALAADLGTETGAPPAAFAAMATVRLPGAPRADWPAAVALRDALWRQARIELLVTPLGGALWARLSAAAYNGPSDYAGLGDALRAALGAAEAAA